ncbi:hypothetical protein [Sphingobacterium sp. IITKGP-BTPF85]|uniref:hypothetical protein n=1 Tax=Sphingobacterium sp. IITKGP-BTPF85 TaxID=1338009 RepID=UPI001E542AB9|nr:hypothetical protein [Sphingobacterium sp. IITKGP-BTPF85]
MKRTLLFAGLLMTIQMNFAQDWKPAGSHILTSWGEQVNVEKPHPEYPRPQLVRSNNWQNLNGLWKYAITPVDAQAIPTQWKVIFWYHLLLNHLCLA